MTYALKIKSSTGGAGEQDLMQLDPAVAANLAAIEEKTHSFIQKYFNKDSEILEAGCGLGRWMIYMNDLGYKMHGIDISESAIQSIKSVRPELELTVGDISNMPFNDEQFDYVLSDGVVEHDPDGPEKMLREIYRVMKPGGILLVIVPVQNWLRALIHRPLCAIRYTVYFFSGKKLEFEEYRFSAHDFARRVKRTGWDIIEHSWVELTPDDRSYSLWVDWGNLLREKNSDDPFKLNSFGTMLKRLSWKVSPWITAEGIIIAAKKI